MTGFYATLNGNDGAGMTGFSPEVVLRILPGLQVVQDGREPVTLVSATPPGRHTGTLSDP